MTFIDVVATSAVVLNIIGYSMRTMIPLRIVAIVTNVLFIVYSSLAGVYPTLYLHAILSSSFQLLSVRIVDINRTLNFGLLLQPAEAWARSHL